MAGTSHHLVSFENVSASVGGCDISSIAELRLVAPANGIPQITLSVDAENSAGGAGAADAATLSNAKGTLEVCREMVKRDDATLSLSLTCRTVGSKPGADDVQTLTINGWLLTDVALTPVQRHGVCLAALTFQHPVCKAHLGGAIPGMVALNPNPQMIKGGNPLALFISAVRAYEQVKRTQPLPTQVNGATSAALVRSMLLGHLSKAVSDLESTVTWTHGGLPASGYLAMWAGTIFSAGFSNAYAVPGAANSLFQALVGHVVPECSLALGGDYTSGTLELGPFEPWADASLAVDDSDIVTLDLPQTDPSPISGVRIAMAASGGGTFTSWNVPGFQAEGGQRIAEAYYVPSSELTAPYLYGPIQQFSEPGWLAHAAAIAATASAAPASDGVAARTGGMVTATNTPRTGGTTFLGGGARSAAAAVGYASAVVACAKAYFETSYTKDWSFSIGARLMFSSGGARLCPGRVVKVTSGGDTVLEGYVVQVEHVISVANRTASTKVVCTHPRIGGLPSVITSTKNALYN